MKKRFTILFGAFCVLMILISMPGKAVGQVSSATPANGNSYVVAVYVNSKYYALPNGAVSSGTISGTEITLNAINKVNTSDATGKTWTLEEGTGDHAGQYYIKYTSGSDTYYLYKNGTSTTNYKFAVNKSSKNYWSFTANGTGTGYTVTAVDRGSNNLYIQYNSGAFRCYREATAIRLLEIGNVPSYTVTAESNNTEYGTVSLSGFVITGSPKTGYQYASPAYTVTSGTATVSQSGNAFTVTPSSNCTVRINFEEKPKYTASFSVDGAITSAQYKEGETIIFPDDPADINDKTFVGWAASAIDGTTQTAPTFVTSATMGNSNVTYYAVFATVASTTEDSWTETALGSMTSSDIFVIAAGDHAMTNNNGTSNAPAASGITVDGTTLTGTINDNLKWNVSGNSTNGYTFYPNGTTSTWLYCSTTDNSGSNNNIRVGTGDTRKVWKLDNDGYLVTKDSYTVRYLSKYNDTDFRGYVTTDYGAFVPTFYKFIEAGSSTYENYCTTVVTYTVTYYANGATSGDVPTDPTAYSRGATVTVLGNGNLAKTGYVFEEWTTESNGDGNGYNAGGQFIITENTKLYAQWIADANEYAIATSATNGSVTVTVGESPVTQTHTGQTVNVSVAANSGYMFDNIVVSKTDDSSTTIETSGNVNDGFTFIMPPYAVTVTATFNACYIISFKVNGIEKEQRVITQGGELGTLPALTSGDIPTGFVFKGWTTLNEYYNTTDAPAAGNMISAETIPSANTTYNAVFAQYESGTETGELTGNEIATNFSNIAYANNPSDYEDSSDNITWTVKGMNGVAKHRIQLRNNATPSYIGIVAPGNIISVDLKISNATNPSGGDDDITQHGYFNGTIYLNTSIDGTTFGSTTCSNNSSNDITVNKSANTSGNYSTLYIQVTAAARIWNVLVNYETIEYKNFTTTVTNQNISGNTTGETRIFGEIAATAGFTNNGTITIYDGGVLNMGNYKLTNTDATKLIIEDGGQLILDDDNPAITATVKKNISAPSAWTQDNKTGWYAISSTVGTISDITSVSNFANQTFDLYKYVESSNVGYGWINYAAHTEDFGGLVNGHGYLYAHSNGATVSFTGNVNHTDVKLTGLTANNTANVNLQGIHFVGNPYTHNIYKGVALTATAGGMAETYYRLDGNNLWVVESDDTPIGPGQGFLVKVTENNTSLTFSNNASSSKANNDYIRFAVSNSEYEDATFALFQKGEGLRKINHRNTEAPMIYISQNDANYASATMDDDTKSFNLNFEAKTMGQYKLSYKVNGEFNYLHVIDRTTGEDIDMLLEGSYSFIGSPMDNPSRFIVRLGYLPNYDDNGKDIFAYQNGNDIVVSGEGELQIFDVMGRKVSTMNIYGIETVNGLAQGVYIFRLEGKTQKIVVR